MKKATPKRKARSMDTRITIVPVKKATPKSKTESMTDRIVRAIHKIGTQRDEGTQAHVSRLDEASTDLKTLVGSLVESLSRTRAICDDLQAITASEAALARWVGDRVIMALFASENLKEVPISTVDKALKIRQTAIDAIREWYRIKKDNEKLSGVRDFTVRDLISHLDQENLG
jgi:hypothetical protein